MRKHTSAFAALGATVAALLTLTGTAQGVEGQKTFYTNAPAFQAADGNGTFTGQVNYNAPDFPLAWSFDISPKVEAIATSPMDCTAGVQQPQPPYHDHHAGVPVTYLWHSTVRATPLDTDTDLWGNCRFSVNVGGRPGVANLNFAFHYRIHNGPIGAQQNSADPKLTSDLNIKYAN